MKIVGFEANGGARLGVVEGDNVIDLQSVDANVPVDLGEVLRRSNGDLQSLVLVNRTPGLSSYGAIGQGGGGCEGAREPLRSAEPNCKFDTRPALVRA